MEYHLEELLGSVRAAGNSVVQENAFYPFGALIGSLSSGGAAAGANRYKHTGKETIPDFELGYVDNGARWRLNALSGIGFGGIDPLAAKYPWITPYSYCAGNPVKYTDPTGMFFDDYYNEHGVYLYTDMKTTDYLQIIKQDAWNQIQENHGATLGGFKQSDLSLINDLEQNSTTIDRANLSAEAISNVFTDIISKMGDLDVNNLYNEKVSVYTGRYTSKGNPAGYNDPNMVGFASEETLPNNTSKVTINGNELWKLNTISNIQNLMIHEFKGHGYPLNYSDKDATHHKAYELQFRHRTWKNTTSAFQSHMLNNYYEYLKMEKK